MDIDPAAALRAAARNEAELVQAEWAGRERRIREQDKASDEFRTLVRRFIASQQARNFPDLTSFTKPAVVTGRRILWRMVDVTLEEECQVPAWLIFDRSYIDHSGSKYVSLSEDTLYLLTDGTLCYRLRGRTLECDAAGRPEGHDVRSFLTEYIEAHM